MPKQPHKELVHIDEIDPAKLPKDEAGFPIYPPRPCPVYKCRTNCADPRPTGFPMCEQHMQEWGNTEAAQRLARLRMSPTAKNQKKFQKRVAKAFERFLWLKALKAGIYE